MRLKVKIEGLRDLERALKDLESMTGKHTRGKSAIKRAMLTAAQPVADTANSLAPDGRDWAPDAATHLNESFKVGGKLTPSARRRHKRFRDPDAVEMFIGTELVHGHHVEFGTRKQSAQPSLTPAWEQHKQQVLDDLIQEMWQQVLAAVSRAQRQAARAAKAGK